MLRDCEIFNVPDLNSDRGQAVLREIGNAIIACNSGLIRRRTLSDNPDIFFLNKHCSRLPQYRGVNNIEWALWEGQPIFGTVLRINYGIDEGDILYQQALRTHPSSYTSFAEFRAQCMKEVFGFTGRAVSLYLQGKASFTQQLNRGEALFQYYSMHPILKERMLKKLGFK